jgi:DNA-binding MarR family transcriptional regulator
VTVRELTDSDYQTLASFRHALRVFTRFSDDAARAAGVTPNQHQLLLAIRGAPDAGGPSSGGVAESLQLQHHSVVELVDRAVEAGLVTRRVDEHDRRRHRLALTATGRRKLAALTAAHRAELRRFRNQLSAALDILD